MERSKGGEERREREREKKRGGERVVVEGQRSGIGDVVIVDGCKAIRSKPWNEFIALIDRIQSKQKCSR